MIFCVHKNQVMKTILCGFAKVAPRISANCWRLLDHQYHIEQCSKTENN